MRKMRKLLSLVMVFIMLTSLVTIGASAEDQGNAIIPVDVVAETAESEENAPEHEHELDAPTANPVEGDAVTEIIAEAMEEVPQEPASESNDNEGAVTEEIFETSGEDTPEEVTVATEDEILSLSSAPETCEVSEEEATSEDISAIVELEETAVSLWDGEGTDANGPSLDSCDVLVEGELYYSYAYEVLELVNAERVDKGEDPLVMDEAILEHAMMRAVQIALYCTHNQPDGAGPGYGCSTYILGENIAYGYTSPSAAVEGWTTSPGHYYTYIDSSYVSTGIGVFQVGDFYFWVQCFSAEEGTEVFASNYTDGFISDTVSIADYRIDGKITPTINDAIIETGTTTGLNVKFKETDEGLAYNVSYELPPEGLVLSSSDESVCTIAADGTITGVGEGTATITAYYPGYEEGAWELTVTVCDHAYTNEVTTAPTCISTGIRTYTCPDCGDSYTEEISALGHDYDDGVVTKEPGCETYGERTYTCRNDSSHTKTEAILPTLTHSYDAGVVTTEPTCAERGVMTYTCTLCGGTKTSDVSPTYDHDYDDGVVTTEPTCGAAGVMTYTCTVCSGTKTSRISATGEHAYDAGVVTTEPACNRYGITTYTCSDCGAQKTSTISPTDHPWDEGTVTTEPGCTTLGTMLYTCTSCGTTQTSTILANGHSWDEGVVTTEPGCTSNGVRTFTCTECSSTRTANIAAIGHDYSIVESIKEAECETVGRDKQTCANCGKYRYVSVPATGHSSVTDPYVAPACEETGLTEGSHCETCSAILAAQETIAALGHAWDDGSVTKEQNCTETGTRTYICQNDTAHTKDETIPANGHFYESTVYAPTCTEEGYTEHICSVCQDTYQDAETAVLGHAWDEGDITKMPTCTEKGTMTYTCQNDSEHTQTEPVTATGHSYASEVTAPICTEAGYTTHTCGNCNDSYTDSPVDKLGHDMDDGVITTDPTCTEAGERTYSCSRCEETRTEDVAALGHTPVTDAAVAPGCETEGLTEGSHCEVCGAVLVAQSSVAATGHTWNDGVTTKYPTVNAEGELTYTCTSCAATKAETLPKLDRALLGDVNGDGRVSYADESVLARAVAKWDITYDIGAADINCDGKISRIDMTWLRRYNAGWDTPYPIGSYVGEEVSTTE